MVVDSIKNAKFSVITLHQHVYKSSTKRKIQRRTLLTENILQLFKSKINYIYMPYIIIINTNN